jgi:hypothetical protein
MMLRGEIQDQNNGGGEEDDIIIDTSKQEIEAG